MRTVIFCMLDFTMLHTKITNELLVRHLILLMVITIVHPVTLHGLKSILFRNMFSYIFSFCSFLLPSRALLGFYSVTFIHYKIIPLSFILLCTLASGGLPYTP